MSPWEFVRRRWFTSFWEHAKFRWLVGDSSTFPLFLVYFGCPLVEFRSIGIALSSDSGLVFNTRGKEADGANCCIPCHTGFL